MGTCPACGKEGLHYAPPSMGDPGFFTCQAWVRRKSKLDQLTAEAQANGEYDDGPPRLYDVVALGGGNLALLLEHVGGERWMALRIVPVFANKASNVIARNVYDIREAMRLMRETE